MHRQVSNRFIYAMILPHSRHLIFSLAFFWGWLTNSILFILQPEHVIQFLFAEMGTTGSVDGAGRLVIKGRFQQKQIENVLRRYMGELRVIRLILNKINI